jgi:hypothetical protein
VKAANMMVRARIGFFRLLPCRRRDGALDDADVVAAFRRHPALGLVLLFLDREVLDVGRQDIAVAGQGVELRLQLRQAQQTLVHVLTCWV